MGAGRAPRRRDAPERIGGSVSEGRVAESDPGVFFALSKPVIGRSAGGVHLEADLLTIECYSLGSRCVCGPSRPPRSCGSDRAAVAPGCGVRARADVAAPDGQPVRRTARDRPRRTGGRVREARCGRASPRPARPSAGPCLVIVVLLTVADPDGLTEAIAGTGVRSADSLHDAIASVIPVLTGGVGAAVRRERLGRLRRRYWTYGVLIASFFVFGAGLLGWGAGDRSVPESGRPPPPSARRRSSPSSWRLSWLGGPSARGSAAVRSSCS